MLRKICCTNLQFTRQKEKHLFYLHPTMQVSFWNFYFLRGHELFKLKQKAMISKEDYIHCSLFAHLNMCSLLKEDSALGLPNLGRWTNNWDRSSIYTDKNTQCRASISLNLFNVMSSTWENAKRQQY